MQGGWAKHQESQRDGWYGRNETSMVVGFQQGKFMG